MKKLFVCGDSFLSPSVKLPGQHMSEIIAKKLNFELVPLARGGMSNSGICLQLEHAIKEKADFILLTTTFQDRIEIPVIDSQGYTIDDVFYCDDYSLSSNLRNNKLGGKLIIDTLTSLTSTENHNYTKYYNNAVKNISSIKKFVRDYVLHSHKLSWKTKTDSWALYATLHKLHCSNIPYLIVIDRMKVRDICPWISEKNTLLDFWSTAKSVEGTSHCIFSFGANIDKEKFINYEDPGFHTRPEEQEFLSEIIIKHIVSNKL